MIEKPADWVQNATGKPTWPQHKGTGMTDEAPSSRDGIAAVRSALTLDDALDRLDASARDQSRLLHRMVDLAGQIDRLSRAPGPLGADARSKLKTLNARFAASQKSLEKARRTVARDREAYARALQDCHGSADRMAAMAADLRAGLSARQRQISALDRALNVQFQRQCRAQLPPDDTAAADDFQVPGGSYDYIPLPMPRFLDLLIQLDLALSHDPAYACDNGRYRPVSFLEIGCGTGRIVELARHAGLCRLDRCHGFDINPDTVAMGRGAFDLDGALTVADALDFDYAPYDVIYSFRPFSDNDLQIRLEARLAATMRDTAYLIAPMSQDLARYPELAPVGQSQEIWQKRL